MKLNALVCVLRASALSFLKGIKRTSMEIFIPLMFCGPAGYSEALGMNVWYPDEGVVLS